MKINYIYIKKILIATFLLLAIYALLNFMLAAISNPRNIEISFSPISGSFSSPAIEQNISLSPTISGFNYKLIGYRAGKLRASVIVEKDNQTYVVQQGDLLQNRYKLISVDSGFAIFSQNGKSYQLSTNLQLEN